MKMILKSVNGAEYNLICMTTFHKASLRIMLIYLVNCSIGNSISSNGFQKMSKYKVKIYL